MRGLLFGVALLAFATPSFAAEVVVTDISSPLPLPAGTVWGSIPGENRAPGGAAEISTDQPRSGNGSLELHGDRTRVQTGVQYNGAAGGTSNLGLLDNVQSLTFDWLIAPDSARTDYSPALRLLVQSGESRSELIWEAAYNGFTAATLPSTVGTWQTSAADALFWQFVAGAGPNEAGGSLQLRTLTGWADYYTNAGAFVSGLSVGAGSGATGGYHAYVDNVTYTTTAGATTYNFEAVPAVPEPGTWAMMLVGFGAMGTVMRRHRRATPQLRAA